MNDNEIVTTQVFCMLAFICLFAVFDLTFKEQICNIMIISILGLICPTRFRVVFISQYIPCL